MNRLEEPITLLAITVLLFALLVPKANATDLEFDGLVSGIEQRYQIRRDHIPFVGFISFCGWVYTRGGVRGFRFAEFEDTGTRVSADDFDEFVRERLGTSWHMIVRTHERESQEDTIIYAQARGDKFLMVIAEVENGEVSLVKLGIRGDKLHKWLNHRERRVTK